MYGNATAVLTGGTKQLAVTRKAKRITKQREQKLMSGGELILVLYASG
jgi:hypothetical protein